MPSPRMFICALMSQTSLTGPRLIPMRAERMSGGSEAMFLRTAIPTERASSGSPRKAIAAGRVRLLEKGGRREDAFLESEKRHRELERPGAAEQVAVQRLGRADRHVAGGGSEHDVDRLGLDDIADRSRGAVGVDVADRV